MLRHINSCRELTDIPRKVAAKAADQYLGNRNDVPPGLRTIFRRFWDRVRHFLVKIGFATDKQRVEDLFRRMENDQLTGEGVQDGDGERFKPTGSRIDIDPIKFIDNQLDPNATNKYADGYVVVKAGNGIDVIIHVGATWIGKDGKEHGFGLKHIEKHLGITGKRLLKGLREGATNTRSREINYILKINDNDTLKIGVSRGWDNDSDVYVMKTAFIYGKDGEPRIQTLDSRNGEMPANSSPSVHPDTIIPKPDVTSRHKLLGIYGVMKWAKGKKLDKLMGNLTLAERMFREGYNAKAVRYATGWEIGIDGKWRYELPDIEVKIKNMGGTFMSIDGITQPMDAATNGYSDKIKNHLLPHKLTKFPTIVIEGLEDSLLDAVFVHGNSNSVNWSEPIGWLSHGSRLGTIIGDRELTTTERSRVQRWVRANTKHILSLDLKQHKEAGKLQEHDMENPSHILSFLKGNHPKGRYWSIQLPELLDDKDLFKAYPSMKDIEVVFHPMTMGGYFSERNNIIGVDIRYGEPGTYFTGRLLAWLKETMLHEAQHAIQSLEGFARGGNEKSANRDFPYVKMTAEEKYMHLLGEVESRNVEFRSHYGAKKLRNTPLEETEDRNRERQLSSTYDKAVPILFGDKMIRMRNYAGKLVPVRGELDYFLPLSIRSRIEKEMEAMKKNILEKDGIETGHYTAILEWLFEKGMGTHLATNRIDAFLEHDYQKAVEEAKTQWRYNEAPKKWQEIYDKAWERIPEYLRKMNVIRPGVDKSLWREIRTDEIQSKESLREALIRNTWNREDNKALTKQVVDQFFIELQSLPQAPKWGERLLGYANATEMSEAIDKAFRETEKEIKSLKKVTKANKQALMAALNHLDGEASDITRIAAKAARITSQERVAAAAVRFKTLPAEQQVKETMDLMYAAGRSILEQKLPNRFSKEVLQNMIGKDMKDEETLAFLLPDFLEQAPDMISKKELLKWMDDNEIKVQVTKLDSSSAQYERYSTKTGTNYREYLFSSPRAENYKAPHFGRNNQDLIMHMRLSDVDEKANRTRINNDKVKWLKPSEKRRGYIRTTIKFDTRISEEQLRQIDRHTEAPWAEYIHEYFPEGVTAIELYDLMIEYNYNMLGNNQSEAEENTAEAFDAIGIQGIQGELIIEGEAINPPGLIIEELQSDYHQAARKRGYGASINSILSELNAAIGTNIRTLEQLAVEQERIRREYEEKLREHNKANPPYRHLYSRIYANEEGAIEELRKIKDAKPYFDILKNIDRYAINNKLTTQEKDKLVEALHDALFSFDNDKKSIGFTIIRTTPVPDEEGIKGLLIHRFDIGMEEFSRKEFAKEFLSAQVNESGFKAKHSDIDARLSKIATASRKIREIQDGETLPNIPFKKFHEFLFKYALLEAAQKGYGHIYWTTGYTQANRYGRNNEREQGMKGFYDDIVVKYANKLAKKYGTKADTKTLPGRYENGHREIEFNHLEITPEMRSDLVGKGLPRYKTLEPAPDQQMEEIRKQYEGTEQWMKAPNGKPTNLNERQWLQVRTPNFKAWFGDWENDPANASKVVDENGEPMVVYHGTPNAQYSVFNPETYFTGDAEYATLYTNANASSVPVIKEESAPAIYPVFLNIKRPFDTRMASIKKDFEENFYMKHGNGTPLTDIGLPDWTDGFDLSEWIVENDKPYDGMMFYEGGVPDGRGGIIDRGISYAPLQPTQIKSATANTGTFSSENADIRYKLVDEGVNRKFNEEIEQLFNEEIGEHHVFQLGSPGAILKAAGIPSKPIQLLRGTLRRKIKRHNLTKEQVLNLPKEINDPIFVMKSLTEPNSMTVFTEIEHSEGNVLVAIDINRIHDNLSVNDVRSLYGKSIAKINELLTTKSSSFTYINKEKCLDYLSRVNGSNRQMPEQITKAIDKLNKTVGLSSPKFAEARKALQIEEYSPKSQIRYRLLDEDIEERLREAKKLLQQHNQEYAKISKEAAEKIAEKIVDETGVEPIAGKEKIARMIRAAYREGEEKARASMAILKIANVGQKIATNKPESTDRSDMTFHLDEAEQYAKDMGISQDELDSLGADGYTFYAQGLNLFAYGNTLYDQLLEKRSQANFP